MIDALSYTSGAAFLDDNDDTFHINGNNNLNNSGCSRGMTPTSPKSGRTLMKSFTRLYPCVCEYKNLELAYERARKGKTQRPYIIAFEKNLTENLSLLQTELLLHAYRPLPLRDKFIKDPKTRRISISNFRDRIVHHAICNIIEPIYDRRFIHDSFANRKGKGTLAAAYRLETFISKVSRNKTVTRKTRAVRGFCFKGDIRHYFDTVSQKKLLGILGRTIRDRELLFLIKTILQNHRSDEEEERGMPLGNLTSQFFANVYLNELDQYAKHVLRMKYYIRYVDDFVILHESETELEVCKERIRRFLQEELLLTLHKEKSRIGPLSRGIDFLGNRHYPHHQLLRTRNVRRIYWKLMMMKLRQKRR